MSEYPFEPDPAAVLGAAVSLYQTAWEYAETEPRVNLSECYNGGDEFMRQVMRVAIEFEHWSCAHVVFEEVDEVWPYLLESSFGEACLWSVGGPGTLSDFDKESCRRVAWKLRLPLKDGEGLPMPVDVMAMNSSAEAGLRAFRAFRIQTVRHSRKGSFVEAFTQEADPSDKDWSSPYFSLYGVEEDGLSEHIADRATYVQAVALARKLAPGIAFPDAPFARRW